MSLNCSQSIIHPLKQTIMKKYKYVLTTRFDVYEFNTLKELLDRQIPIAGLLGVRSWRKEIV